MAGAGAGASTHFSIRGYAARARTGAADEGSRSWPFGGDAGALPPVEVQLFRWWAHEAALLEEEEQDEERRMASKRRKRSVAELFAAVPRVTAGKGKRARTKLLAGVKKGSKKEKAAAESSDREKEKTEKVDANSLSISQLFQDSMQKKKLKKSLGKKKRDQEVSVLSSKKSPEGNKKTILADQKAIRSSCQVQSILKKYLVLKNTDVVCPSKSCHKPKHVTFSDEDHICGLAASQPEDNTDRLHALQASRQPSQDDRSQVVDDQCNTDEPQLVSQRVDAISISVEEDTNSLPEKVGSTGVCCTVPVTKSTEKTIPAKSVDLNHWIEMSNRGSSSNSISSAALSSEAQNFAGEKSHLQEGQNLDARFQAKENHRMIRPGSVPASLPVDTRSGDLMRSPFSQPSASLKQAHDRSRSTLLQESRAANYHMTDVHPSIHKSGKDVVSSKSSSTGSNKPTDVQIAECVSARRNMDFANEYTELPLNSHGEFIRVQPGGTLSPNEAFKRRCLGEDPLHPSTSSDFSTHGSCMNYAHLIQVIKPTASHNFGFHPDPYPTTPTAYGIDYRQLPGPGPERMEAHNYAIANKSICSKQQEHLVKCFCSGCMRQAVNQPHMSLEMQNCTPRHNFGQNIQPATETTMRLMGKTVTFGITNKQCRGLDNNGPSSSEQVRDEDHYFHGTRRNVSRGGLVDLPRTFWTSNLGGQPSKYQSRFSSVPAAEPVSGFGINSFRTSNHSEQPLQAVQLVTSFRTSNHSQQHQQAVQPVSRYNEAGQGHQRPAVAAEVQSTFEHPQLGSVHGRRTQSVATKSSYDPKNSFKNFVETRAESSQFSYFPQRISNMTQRIPVSTSMSGYAVQRTPGSTTETKFTSLRPLPPSMISSQVYNNEDAQPHGSAPLYPTIPPPLRIAKANATGGTSFKDSWSMKQAAVRSNLDFRTNKQQLQKNSRKRIMRF